MTKKFFKEQVGIHKYTGGPRENNITAIFFDWKSGDKDGKVFVGFKYCVFARACNAKTDELLTALYNFIEGKTTDVQEWWIQLVVAQDDMQRFKVPIMGSGLNSMRGKYIGEDNE
jgi:hypothetical protein